MTSEARHLLLLVTKQQIPRAYRVPAVLRMGKMLVKPAMARRYSRSRLTTTFHRLVVFAGLILLLAAPMAVVAQAPAGVQGFDSSSEEQMVNLINEARAQNGLPPLAVDRRLTQAARKHSQVMAQRGTIAHEFPGEPTPQMRIANESVPANSISENVALSNRGILSAHDGLMHSPPHRAAILSSDYNAVGVGVFRAGDTIYVTEDFAHMLPEYSEPQAEAHVQSAIEQYARAHSMIPPARQPQPQLRRLACNMALNDSVNTNDVLHLPGVHTAVAWTSSDPGKLPQAISQVLSPQVTGYSLGACFAPSVSHPGGVYWLVMVTH